MIKRALSAAIAACVLLCTVGCQTSSDLFLFGVSSLEFYGGDTRGAERAALSFLSELEREISVTDAGSDVAKINSAKAGERVAVGEHTAELFRLSGELFELTGGAFDPSVYPAVRLWGFAADQTARSEPPLQEEIDAVLPLIGFRQFSIDGSFVTKTADGAMLDFGGIAKGYAADRVAEIARGYGVTGGIADIGGNLFVIGSHPEGRPYNIRIAAPVKRDSELMKIRIEDCAVAVSGNYERYFTYEGIRYCHIIDPASALPADGGMMSVAVISGSGAACDALSTAGFIMGAEAAFNFFTKSAISAVVCFYRDGQKSYYTTGGVDCYDVNEGYLWTDVQKSNT